MSLKSQLASLPQWHGGEAAYEVRVYGPQDWQVKPTRMAEMTNVVVNTSFGDTNFKKVQARATLLSGDQLAHGGLTFSIYGADRKIQFLSPCCLSPLGFRPVSRKRVQYEACRHCSNPLVLAPAPLTGGGRRRSSRNSDRHPSVSEALARWTDLLEEPLLATLAALDLTSYAEKVFTWSAECIEAEEKKLKAERVRANQEAKRLKTRSANEAFLAGLLEDLQPCLEQDVLAQIARAGEAKLDS